MLCYSLGGQRAISHWRRKPDDFDIMSCELVDSAGVVLDDGDCSLSSIEIVP